MNILPRKHKDKVEVYLGEDGDFYWRYVADNGHNMANGSQGYSRRIDCVNAAKRVFGLGGRLQRSVQIMHKGEVL